MYHKYNKLLATALAVSMLSQNGMVVLADEVDNGSQIQEQQDSSSNSDKTNNLNQYAQPLSQNENEVATQESTTTKSRVYIYVDKVWLINTGSKMEVNGTGQWVTFGFIDVVFGPMTDEQKKLAEPENADKYLSSTDPYYLAVKQAIEKDGFVPYSGNTENIKPGDRHISWTGYDYMSSTGIQTISRGLRVSYGANDYTEVGDEFCWHLDGTYITYQQKVNVNYIDMSTNKQIKKTETRIGDVNSEIALTEEDKKIDGYTFVYCDKEKCTVEDGKEGEINVYFVPDSQKISMTIQGKTGEQEYDGTKQTNSTPDVKIGETTYKTELIDGELKFTYGNKDYYIKGYTLGSGTNYEENGYSDSYTDIKILNGEKVDVTNAFNISQVIPGKLNITKRTITIKADDQIKQYTGKEVQADKDKYNEVVGEDKSSKLVKGDSISASVEGAGIDVDKKYEISFVENSVKITNKSDDVSSNYNITLVPGTLRLVKKEYALTINTPDVTTSYDGQNHTLSTIITGQGITQVGKSLKINIDGKEYTIQGYTPASGTDSDTYTTSVDKTIKIVDEKGNEAPYAFNINVEYAGKLTINPIAITLKSNSGYKTYDGSALTISGITQTGEFVSGEKPSIEVIGRVTEVSEGHKSNTIQVGSYNTKNYVITKEEGDLYILPKSIKENTLEVTKPSDVKYNGEKQELEPEVVDSVTGKPLEKDKDYTLSYGDNTKDVGTVTVTITGKGNYKDTVDTTYEIKKAPLTISASNAEKEYDGKPLTSSTTTITGLKGNDTISATASGSITDVGNTANVVDKDSVNWSGANPKNYDVKYVDGNLKITPKSITSDIQIDIPKDVDYNGNSQQQPPRITDKDGHELVEGKDYDISYSEDTTNVGTVTVKITGKGNYKDSNSYTYKIKPIDLEIKVSDLNSKYTGNTITPNSNGYQISGKLANGDEIFITLGGGKKNPGTYKNELHVKDIVIRRNGVDVTKNYNIKTIPGTLTISSALKNPNTGVENKTGLFTSMFVASGAILLALFDRKNRK